MLPRVVGVPGAVGLGLGSILGTGIFVSIGIAAEVAGPGRSHRTNLAIVCVTGLALLAFVLAGLPSPAPGLI